MYLSFRIEVSPLSNSNTWKIFIGLKSTYCYPDELKNYSSFIEYPTSLFRKAKPCPKFLLSARISTSFSGIFISAIVLPEKN